jgi:hypothetical protein
LDFRTAGSLSPVVTGSFDGAGGACTVILGLVFIGDAVGAGGALTVILGFYNFDGATTVGAGGAYTVTEGFYNTFVYGYGVGFGGCYTLILGFFLKGSYVG